MILKQFDTNFSRVEIEIKESGVNIKNKDLSSDTETFTDFEFIGTKIIKNENKKFYLKFISFSFLFIAILVFIGRIFGNKVSDEAEVFHLIASLIFGTLYLITKKNIIYLAQDDNTNAITFIGAKRYKEDVDNFINEIIERRNTYLLNKYSNIDDVLPYYQQYNNLIWLYNLKLLTKNELNLKISELDKIDFYKIESEKSNHLKIVDISNNNKEIES